MWDIFALHYSLAGNRIHAVVGQRGAHLRQLSDVNADGALFGVDVDGLQWIGVNPFVFQKQRCKRPIAHIRRRFRFVDLVDQRQLLTGSPAVIR
jgi:hypothetical protein